MRKLLVVLVLMMPVSVFAETFDELVDSIDAPIASRIENGVIKKLDLAARTVQISGYDYYVSPRVGENVTEIILYGTSYGSFEFLSVGMTVEVEYLDLQRARIAMVIKELNSNLEVEH